MHLLSQNFYVHPIILNNQNQILTYISNEPYILMITIYYENKININDIIAFSNSIAYTTKPNNWGNLWSQKKTII